METKQRLFQLGRRDIVKNGVYTLRNNSGRTAYQGPRMIVDYDSDKEVATFIHQYRDKDVPLEEIAMESFNKEEFSSDGSSIKYTGTPIKSEVVDPSDRDFQRYKNKLTKRKLWQ